MLKALPSVQYTNPMNLPLHEYQLYCKYLILTYPAVGLFMQCGTGKTLTTLAALYELNPNGNVLVIAPKNIARSTWFDEIEKWGFPFRTKSLLLNERGKDLSRKKRYELYNEALTAPPTIYFINTEKIPDLINNLPKNEQGQPIWAYPYVIIDESQTFKSYNSTRFEELKKVRPCIQKIIELTGTPTPKDLQDLWSQIYLLDQGQRLGDCITRYRERYFRPGRIINNHPVDWRALPGAEEAIYRQISDIVVSVKNTEIKLPDIIYNNVTVHMNDDEVNIYKELLHEQVIDIGEHEVTASNAGVLAMKLAQMASGGIYVDEHHNFELIHEHKAEHCEYIINNTNSPVIIAYWFDSDKQIILNYFEKQRKSKKSDIEPVVFDNTPEMQKRWNNGEIPVMLLQPASSGRGLNLQTGGHTMIFYTVPDSLELYIQTVARIYRQGQTHSVIIHRLVTKGTHDERKINNVETRTDNQNRLIDAVCINDPNSVMEDVIETIKMAEEL